MLLLSFYSRCFAQKQTYSKPDVSRIKIAYNKLVDKQYDGKSVIISDSLSSRGIVWYANELFKKEEDQSYKNELKFKEQFKEFEKKFVVRDSFPLKKTLENFNERGDYVFFFSKLIENVLLIKVTLINHDLADVLKTNENNYPYLEYFSKNPTKYYYFTFDENDNFEMIEVIVTYD